MEPRISSQVTEGNWLPSQECCSRHFQTMFTASWVEMHLKVTYNVTTNLCFHKFWSTKFQPNTRGRQGGFQSCSIFWLRKHTALFTSMISTRLLIYPHIYLNIFTLPLLGQTTTNIWDINERKLAWGSSSPFLISSPVYKQSVCSCWPKKHTWDVFLDGCFESCLSVGKPQKIFSARLCENVKVSFDRLFSINGEHDVSFDRRFRRGWRGFLCV